MVRSDSWVFQGNQKFPFCPTGAAAFFWSICDWKRNLDTVKNAYEKKPDPAQLRTFCLKIILLGFLYTASNFGICMLDISAVDEKGVNYKLLLVLD